MSNNRAEKEKQILDAASRVFLEKGRAGASMQEIASAAGVNKALLHYYFRSKDHLYETVLTREFDEFAGKFLDSIPETDDIQEFLRFFIHNYTRTLAERLELVRFLTWEIREGGDTLSSVVKRRVFRGEGTQTPFEEIINKALGKGTIRPIDPVQFTISLISVCVYPFVARPIFEKVLPYVDVVSPEFLERREEEIFRLFWQGIRSDEEPISRAPRPGKEIE